MIVFNYLVAQFNMEFKIDLDKYVKKIDKNIKNNINLALEVLKDWVDEKTPEDTKTLLWNTKIEKAKDEWNKIVGKVSNDTEYAIYVELWVWDRAYNYHKPKWTQFYTWIWARMFTRTADEKENEVIKIVSKKILW